MAGGNDAYEADTGEDLPWLEPAELEYEEPGGGIGQRTVLIVAATLVLIVAGLWWIADRYGSDDIALPDGEVPMVAAPSGPYKIAPKDRGGLQVSEAERMTNDVAAGAELPTEVATDRVPEVPVVPPVADGPPPQDLLAGTKPSAAKPKPVPVRREDPPATEGPPMEPKPAPPPPPSASGGSAAIQLGAFSSRSKASEVWKTFQSRYSYLQPLEMALESVQVNGSTLIRLRASVPGGKSAATDLCNRLKLAGEQCVVV